MLSGRTIHATETLPREGLAASKEIVAAIRAGAVARDRIRTFAARKPRS